MKDTRAARRYASALFRSALADGILDKEEEELTHVMKRLGQDKKMWAILLNPVVGWQEKERLLNLWAPETSTLLHDFLRVLIRKRRFPLIAEIQKVFHELYEKHKGIQEVRLISARPLPQKTEERVRSVLKTKLRSEIRLISEVNPKMLGGFVVRFEGKEIDLSYRSRFDALRYQLLSPTVEFN